MKLNRMALCFIIGITTVIAACTTPANSSEAGNATATVIPPFPTQTNGVDLDLVANRSCLLRKMTPVQIDQPQGDLVAWSPAADELAFVEPDNQHWQWYVGELAVYNPVRDNAVVITKGQAVFGDVTWSPEGTSIAYVVLNRDENFYSVVVTDEYGESHLDIFGNANDARTDPWSSKKGILEWSASNGLIVTSSCGSDCARTYTYSTQDSLLTAGDEIRRSEDKSLTPDNDGQSPDGKWNVLSDKEDNVWLTDLSSNRISLLMGNTVIEEVKWSASSNFFALRTADQLLVYRPICTVK